ncbi:T9SS type A sorting domain-containing protein [Olleya sp. AH-315-K02]|nr:T9SS type A sorting domain-containing protein [Olleya sp. AH-315-K02]MBN4057970.1 T9SS type A sorting domain-containing protein [Olleya sp. AH-315-K02]
MKKFYFLFIWFFSLNSFAQNPNLLGEWFLHTITENGNSPIVTTPYIYNLNFNINGTDSSIYNNIGGTDCNAFEAFSTFPSETDLVIQLTALTLGGGCGSSSEGLYLGALFSDPYNIESHNYIITGAGNNEALTLTNSSNDVLIFGRQVLSKANFVSINDLKVFPNPVSDIIFVSNNNYLNKLNYNLFNFNGKLIKTSSVNYFNQIDISNLSSGLYFIRFINKNNDGVKTIKFIKQ